MRLHVDVEKSRHRGARATVTLFRTLQIRDDEICASISALLCCRRSAWPASVVRPFLLPMRIPKVQGLLQPAWMRALVLLLAASNLKKVHRRVMRGSGRAVSSRKRQLAVDELRRLCPPPTPQSLGGEKPDTAMYCRFLSVVNWDPERAASKLAADFKWRQKIKPRILRPSHCQTLARQQAWQVLMQPRPALLAWTGSTNSSCERPNGGSRWFHRGSSSDSSSTSWLTTRAPLTPSHYRPPMQQWRYTKQGLPITLFECWQWRPDKGSKQERIWHIAYHVRRLGITPACAMHGSMP